MLSYREGQFSPSEAAACTGLSLTLQRDWRSQGLLRERTTGKATFSPRDLAEMRVMVKLRSLGLPLPLSREVAEQAASSVLYFAVSDKAGIVLEPNDERGARYLQQFDLKTDGGHLEQLSGLSHKELNRYALWHAGEFKLIPTLHDIDMDDLNEVGAFASLSAVAAALVKEAPRPLYTLIVPASFEKEQGKGAAA